MGRQSRSMAFQIVLALLLLSGSADAALTHSKFVCGQQTTISTSISKDVAGTAEFSEIVTEDGKCHMIQGGNVASVKFCGPGKLVLSRMTCSEHHDYKAQVIEHGSGEYTTNCETISAAGTVVDGWLGSFTLSC